MRKLLSAVFLMLLASQAYAVPASPDTVETLLALTKAEKILDSMYVSMEQTMRQGIQQAMKGKVLTPEQQRILESMVSKNLAVIKEELSWEIMKPQIVRDYCDTFEQEEIDGLIAFYRSAPGQAFVNKMPIIAEKSMANAQLHMQKIRPRIMEVIEKSIAEAILAK